MIAILIASLVVMLASLAGKLTVWRTFGKVIEERLDLLISLSAGVFAVIAYRLAGEAVEHAQEVMTGLAWVLGGAVGIWVLSRLLPQLHHHPEEHAAAPVRAIDVRRVLLSDGVHNIGDGILLAASFLAGPAVGILATVSVFIHEIIQEVSEFFVLRGAGYSSSQALKLNFLVQSTILIGSLGGYFFLQSFEALEVPLLGIASGMVLVLVFHDLIPHSLQTSKDMRHKLLHLLWFAIGALIMLGVAALVPHS